MVATTINFDGTDNPDGILNLVRSLPEPENVREDLTICFPGSYLHGTIFPIIAAWRKSLPEDIGVSLELSKCQESARRLVHNVGLPDIVEKNLEKPSVVLKRHGNVPLQPIVTGHSTHEVLDRVYGMVDDWAGEYRDISAFRTILSELAENVLVHSEAVTPGYIHAAVHKTSHSERCEITFADRGIGILNSYLEGTNEEVKSRVEAGASALEIAIDGLNTSKPKELSPGGRSHFGYGLYTVKRLIEMNRGRMTIISGDEYLTIDRYSETCDQLNSSWNGTIISLLIDLANPLPLEDVYDEEVARLIPYSVDKGSTVKRDESSRQSRPEASSSRSQLLVEKIGSKLLSREDGLILRAEIATALSDGSVVEVIFDGVEDMTPSVADECFGKLAEKLGASKYQQKVILKGGSSILHRLIDFVVANRLKGLK